MMKITPRPQSLIVVSVLALIYGQITYTRDAETANLGPLEP